MEEDARVSYFSTREDFQATRARLVEDIRSNLMEISISGRIFWLNDQQLFTIFTNYYRSNDAKKLITFVALERLRYQTAFMK